MAFASNEVHKFTVLGIGEARTDDKTNSKRWVEKQPTLRGWFWHRC